MNSPTDGGGVVLRGCAPVPLAHYLKALAVLRLVAERDPSVRGRWSDDGFVLESNLGEEDIIQFLLNDYRPTPVVAPWNKGSGFYPWDNQDAIHALERGAAERLTEYREVIRQGQEVLSNLEILTPEQVRAYHGAPTKAAKKEVKAPIARALTERKVDLLQSCRARLADSAIEWLDAAVVLAGRGPAFPPLLGTGGNDGRLDFTNNFMQRLADVFSPESGAPTAASERLLRSALFDEPVSDLGSQAVGQFFPAAAGGFNAGIGFDGGGTLNPWDFVLMIEGALLFASATVKRVENTELGALAFPFAVHQTGAGYGSSASADEAASRAEMWLPIWSRGASLGELRTLMSEGRARVGGRAARNGVDFARALASLGVDRGIDEFQRYAFLERFGRNYLATPLSRHRVVRRPEVDLLVTLDEWLDRFLRNGKADRAPSSVNRMARQVEAAVMTLATRGGRHEVLDLLVALGDAEAAMARSFRWASGRSGVLPTPPLDPRWLSATDDGTVEFRVAAALASVSGRSVPGSDRLPPLRENLAPVRIEGFKGRSRAQWADGGQGDWVPAGSDLIERLNRIGRRRLLRGQQAGHSAYADRGWGLARLSDIAAFIEGRVDDQRIERLLQGLVLLNWRRVSESDLPVRGPEDGILPSAAYAMLRLCYSGRAVREIEVKLAPEVHARAAAGDGRALQMAAMRIRGSGLAPAVDHIWVAGERLERMAAAILIPLASEDVSWLETALRPAPKSA